MHPPLTHHPLLLEFSGNIWHRIDQSLKCFIGKVPRLLVWFVFKMMLAIPLAIVFVLCIWIIFAVLLDLGNTVSQGVS
jgi:hypothetical protein